MTDRPIIFSAPMIRALLDGRKTMTRRLARGEIATGRASRIMRATIWTKATPGDRLWVRETWKPVHSGDPSRGARYQADVGRDQMIWRPSIHMPRWASRLTLTVTATKIERLQEISREDEIAEGTPDGMFFDALWSSIHGNDSWDQNPEVVALTFSVEKRNIDAPADVA